MSKTGNELRDEAAAAVAVAPRVTLEQVESMIDREEFHVFDATLTVCVLTLKNGYKVTGESACASPANFNEALGRKISRERAVGSVWALAGFLLCERQYEASKPPVMRCKVVLTAKGPYVSVHSGPGAPGRTEVRQNSQGRDYHWVDPEDPANYRKDGEFVTFAAVWGGTAEDGGNACLENRIFSKATPSFSLSAHIRNEAVLAALANGTEYYVDFTPAS